MPSGPCIVCFHTPPVRTFIVAIVVVKPFGPHHCTTCSGSVIAFHTSSRGELNTRAMTISRSAVSLAGTFFLAFTFLLLRLKLVQIFPEPVEAFLPVLAVLLDPVRHFLQRLRRDSARSPLRFASARDQPGALQHLEVFGYGGQRHLERFGEFGDRSFSRSEPR